jgi:hypothetical protein
MTILLIWIIASITLAIINYKFNKRFPDLEDKN